MQTFIRASLPTANLELFGSTKNGFGLKGSDMDMCLTFSDNKTGEVHIKYDENNKLIKIRAFLWFHLYHLFYICLINLSKITDIPY